MPGLLEHQIPSRYQTMCCFTIKSSGFEHQKLFYCLLISYVNQIWRKCLVSQIVMLEKTPVSPLDCKETKPVNPKGSQSWIFIGRTVAEAEAPIPWPPDEKSQLIGKYLDAGKNWRQEEKGMTEDEMVRWHHWLDGHEFEQPPRIGDGQGWHASVHGVEKSLTRLRDRTEPTLLIIFANDLLFTWYLFYIYFSL